MIVKWLRDAFPLAGLAAELFVNVVWIGLLGYAFFSPF